MGADLYIEDLPREKQYTGFRTDVGVGYFRDPYNPGNLLWQFELSYWTDIANRFCEKKDGWAVIVPEKAKTLLAELKSRETTFEQNLKDKLKGNDGDANLSAKDRKAWVRMYRKDYETFKRFLNKAIGLNSNILCSL